MWIKTQVGSLVNVDRMDTIMYSDGDDMTYITLGNVYYPLSSGDVRAEIATAMLKGLRFLSVEV